MNINASIVDQRITGIIEDYPEWLPDGDENKKIIRICSTLYVYFIGT